VRLLQETLPSGQKSCFATILDLAGRKENHFVEGLWQANFKN